MFLQRCFYVFIKWASTLSPFLETLQRHFYFYSEKNVCLAVLSHSLFSLCALTLKNNTSVEKKRHVILWKTTRRFDENNTSFLCKQHVVFFAPRNTLFIKELTSTIFRWNNESSQNESSKGDFPLFFKEIIPQNLVNRQKYYKFATQSLQNNLLKSLFCAQFRRLRR